MTLVAVLLLGLQADPAPADEGLLKKGSFPGSYLLPGTKVSVRVGGYLKLDVIHDFDAIGSEDSFDPRTIPTDGSDGENTHLHAKQTRLNLDIRTPTEWGEARLFTEVDFYGTSSALRLRHAYATLGGLLAGQTWSTFMDEDVMPPTLDFEEPVAYAMVRTAQVRWTEHFGDDVYWAVAIESPDSEIEEPAVPAGESEDPYPDLTTRLRWTHGAGHLQVSAFMGWARHRLDTGGEDDEVIWGGLLTGSLKFLERDRLLFQAGYGHGLGRYRGGVVAGPDSDGDLEALPVVAMMLTLEHFWSEDWSSAVTYSQAHATNTDGQSGASLKNIRYASVNLVWRFLSWASVGVEYLYGQRVDNDDSDGEANRVMASFKFMLP